jgi:hypothetical protein
MEFPLVTRLVLSYLPTLISLTPERALPPLPPCLNLEESDTMGSHAELPSFHKLLNANSLT